MNKTDKNDKMSLYDWVQSIMFALVAGVLIFLFVGRIVNVEGSSMYPTLHNGDQVVVSNLFYTPRQGDVVVLRTLTYGSEPLVKRIIAVEGQTVDIDFEEGIVYVDGEALDEPYTAAPTYARLDFDGPYTVPEGCIFVMGDNRNGSTDSRASEIGMIPEECIIGRVLYIAIPEGLSGKRDTSRIGRVA